MAYNASNIARLTASKSASMVTGWVSAHCFMAISGSLMPLPVKVQTMVLPSGIFPVLMSCKAPANEVAEAGSQNTPSYCDNIFCAAKICSSLNLSNQPPDCFCTFQAKSHDCGLPIRIAVASVSGFSIACPATNGAAPAA